MRTTGVEPIQDVAHLAHVEIQTPRMSETLAFFTTVIGLQESRREGASVFLRAWGDYYHHTLKITEADQAGLGHVAWRAVSPQALERRVKALHDGGWGRGWIKGDIGHGPAYRFVDPAGHPMEIFYEVEWHESPAASHTRLKNQPDRRPITGIGARRIDHVNLSAKDVRANSQFMQECMGFRLREHIVHDGLEIGAWLSVTPLVHDIAYMRDVSGADGRFHHVAFWLDDYGDLIRAADILRESAGHIEAGPAKHAITNALFLYLYEPGGNRLELYTGGYLIFPPDWRPVTWTKEDQDLRVWWGGDLPESFFTYATPVAPAKANLPA
ncbi:MAG TPA: catechol 2,3-dioxygenase [bacterium]|nr:catechol 2,3-dioxygenase [bacterium]